MFQELLIRARLLALRCIHAQRRTCGTPVPERNGAYDEGIATGGPVQGVRRGDDDQAAGFYVAAVFFSGYPVTRFTPAFFAFAQRCSMDWGALAHRIRIPKCGSGSTG
ncbi:MAG: hypothetical protein K1X67_15235 [Fimbriimonadaceae bacterium]|nr:hypothetical protein [Fimbriimonadaceae bacterium]